MCSGWNIANNLNSCLLLMKASAQLEKLVEKIEEVLLSPEKGQCYI